MKKEKMEADIKEKELKEIKKILLIAATVNQQISRIFILN